MVRDIFDEVADPSDVFDEIESTENESINTVKHGLSVLLDRFDQDQRKAKKDSNERIVAEVKTLLKSELSKIKPVQNVIEKTIEKQVVRNIHVPVHIPTPPAPAPQKVREIVREVVIQPVKDDKKYVQEKDIEKLTKQVDELKEQLKATQDALPFLGGSGVIGIPSPSGNNGKVLTVVSDQARWQPSAGGASSPDAYTTSHVSTTQSFDATDTSLDELANVIGSLIASLQGAGIIK